MKTPIVLRLTFVLSLCLFAVAMYAQTDTASFSQFLSSPANTVGKDYVFLIYKDGKITYKKEAGSFNLKMQQPVGAASQWLTTALVMMLVQEEKLSLNDKVSDYLQVFSKHGKGYITIANCLTHNTGIQSQDGVGKIFQKKKYHTLEEEVNDYAAKREIGTNPGTEFRYSNMGFNIAARVLEVLTKKTFDRLAQEKLFRPLAMRNTTFANEDYNDAIDAAFGARSTPADYMNFMGMLLNGGRYNGKAFLTSESLKLMFSEFETAGKIKNAPKSAAGFDYGIGTWILDKAPDGKTAAIVSPALTGTWPMVDLCRRYALLLFTKPSAGEPNREVAFRLKAMVDEQVGAACR
jgi:CubicO group peptidase (beta-lactamase class C family)